MRRVPVALALIAASSSDFLYALTKCSSCWFLRRFVSSSRFSVLSVQFSSVEL